MLILFHCIFVLNDNKQQNNMLRINEQQSKLKPTSYIGKCCATTNGKTAPDFTLQMAFLNDFFYKKSGVHFVRMSIATDRPEEFYKRVTKTLRSLNHGRWRKEPVSGFRLCNVQRMSKAWRFTLNIACTGSFYASVIFDELRKLHRAYSRTIYVQFNEPRRTLVDRACQQWYTEFYERSHLLKSQADIDMIERYYWRIDAKGVAVSSLVHLLFDIFGTRIAAIHDDPLNGVEITQSPNVDPDDYFTSDRHLLDCRMRFFQPFGGFYNLLNNKPDKPK